MFHITKMQRNFDQLAWEEEGALKRARVGSVFGYCQGQRHLTTEAVQSAALAFQSVHNVHGGDSFPLGMLSVSDGITDDVLEENLENSASFLVDQARDTLDTATTGQTTDGRLGDTLDVITKHLSVTLGAPLSQTLSSFAATRHAY